MVVGGASRGQVVAFERQPTIGRTERNRIAAATALVQFDVHVRGAVVANRARSADGPEHLAATDALAARVGSIEEYMAEHDAEAALGLDDLDTASLVARVEGPGHGAVERRQHGRATGWLIGEDDVQAEAA